MIKDKSIELNNLKDRCLTIIHFMMEKKEKTESLVRIETIINETFDKKNLKGLKSINTDLTEWAKGFSKAEQQELYLILK